MQTMIHEPALRQRGGCGGVTERPCGHTVTPAIELRDLWRRYKRDGDRLARERLVLAYAPLRGIGEIVGLSESRVSQLHTQAILRLRGSVLAEQLESVCA